MDCRSNSNRTQSWEHHRSDGGLINTLTRRPLDSRGTDELLSRDSLPETKGAAEQGRNPISTLAVTELAVLSASWCYAQAMCSLQIIIFGFMNPADRQRMTFPKGRTKAADSSAACGAEQCWAVRVGWECRCAGKGPGREHAGTGVRCCTLV